MKSADSAKTVWLKTKITLDGNWKIDIDNQEKIISAIDAAMKEYGAQVREEAAKIADTPYSSTVYANALDGPPTVGGMIAAAIRKLELK